jgi:hypothetical protein
MTNLIARQVAHQPVASQVRRIRTRRRRQRGMTKAELLAMWLRAERTEPMTPECALWVSDLLDGMQVMR